VAAGASAAEPHHKPTNRVIRANEFLKIDFGVTFKGWKTDITRTLVLGRPTLVQRKLYALLLNAQGKAARAIKPGIPARELDALARDVISRAGFGKAFIHSTGHGVGRAIHEAPYLSPGPKGDRLLRVGDVITIEPGIYIEGKFGLRIEDMYEVTKTGGRCLSNAIPRILTPPKPSLRSRT
jgi:Xaa-Pro aminopeptidase